MLRIIVFHGLIIYNFILNRFLIISVCIYINYRFWGNTIFLILYWIIYLNCIIIIRKGSLCVFIQTLPHNTFLWLSINWSEWLKNIWLSYLIWRLNNFLYFLLSQFRNLTYYCSFLCLLFFNMDFVINLWFFDTFFNHSLILKIVFSITIIVF